MSAAPDIINFAKSLARVLEEREFARSQVGVEHVTDKEARPLKRVGRR